MLSYLMMHISNAYFVYVNHDGFKERGREKTTKQSWIIPHCKTAPYAFSGYILYKSATVKCTTNIIVVFIILTFKLSLKLFDLPNKLHMFYKHFLVSDGKISCFNKDV